MKQNTIISLVVAAILIGAAFWVYMNIEQNSNNNTGTVDQVQNNTTTEEVEPASNNGNSTSTTHSDINLSNVSDGDTINRVMTIEGEAKGPWYFEADFPVVAKDTSGQTIDTFIATAQSNWMTTNFVPFEVDIDLSNYSGNTAILEFQKDNPSGDPQNDDSYSIQVNLN